MTSYRAGTIGIAVMLFVLVLVIILILTMPANADPLSSTHVIERYAQVYGQPWVWELINTQLIGCIWVRPGNTKLYVFFMYNLKTDCWEVAYTYETRKSTSTRTLWTSTR